jgi:hypothetical protein
LVLFAYTVTNMSPDDIQMEEQSEADATGEFMTEAQAYMTFKWSGKFTVKDPAAGNMAYWLVLENGYGYLMKCWISENESDGTQYTPTDLMLAVMYYNESGKVEPVARIPVPGA